MSTVNVPLFKVKGPNGVFENIPAKDANEAAKKALKMFGIEVEEKKKHYTIKLSLRGTTEMIMEGKNIAEVSERVQKIKYQDVKWDNIRVAIPFSPKLIKDEPKEIDKVDEIDEIDTALNNDAQFGM